MLLIEEIDEIDEIDEIEEIDEIDEMLDVSAIGSPSDCAALSDRHAGGG
jgi:hypothetical protein